jgi:hypothetical protein
MKPSQMAGFVFLVAAAACCSGAGAQIKVTARAGAPLPPSATHCDILLPIRIEIVPLNSPELGKTANFQVHVESSLDPDIVSWTWVEYEIPPAVRRSGSPVGPGLLAKSGASVLDLAVEAPDRLPYAIRARVVVELTNGITISRTATRWINLREDAVPEGMIRRVVDPNGTGIRIYQGVTVRQ